MGTPQVFAVPRRFDLATVLVAMTGFALLFTVLIAVFKSPPAFLAAMAILFAMVAVGQALAIRTENPREASVAAGAMFGIAVALYQVYQYGPHYMLSVLFAPVWGGCCGYLAGTLVGSVFLISHHLRGALTADRWLRWLQRRPSDPSEVAWSDEPPAANRTTCDKPPHGD